MIKFTFFSISCTLYFFAPSFEKKRKYLPLSHCDIFSDLINVEVEVEVINLIGRFPLGAFSL
jgi:hypothetical protein